MQGVKRGLNSGWFRPDGAAVIAVNREGFERVQKVYPGPIGARAQFFHNKRVASFMVKKYRLGISFVKNQKIN